MCLFDHRLRPSLNWGPKPPHVTSIQEVGVFLRLRFLSKTNEEIEMESINARNFSSVRNEKPGVITYKKVSALA